jgi:hypothetical protein
MPSTHRGGLQGVCELPTLFRRREMWLPTWQGSLLLGAVAVAGVVLALRHVGPYLAVDAPAVGRDGHGAPTLVVEGWLEEDGLDQALAALAQGRDQRVVTSGGPIEGWREGQRFGSYAERAADYLRRHGAGAMPVVAAPAPASLQDRTFLSAVVVRDRLRQEGVAATSIDLFSASVHARRSRLTYRLAFGPDVEVGVRAAVPKRYALDRWWATSDGAKATFGELVSLAWTACCFWPPPAETPAAAP